MFRFTIRDVLWLTVVVAVGVGWWIDHSRHQGMTWQWQEMHEAGLFAKGVENVHISYMDGSEAVYDENRGVRYINP